MGKSFESVRMGAKEVSARWLKASRALKKEDLINGQKLAKMEICPTNTLPSKEEAKAKHFRQFYMR